jgi:hypothetical protein
VIGEGRYTAQLKEMVKGLADVQTGPQWGAGKGSTRRIPRSPSDSDLHRLTCRRTHGSTGGRHSTSCIDGPGSEWDGGTLRRQNSAILGGTAACDMTFIPSQGPVSLMPGSREPPAASGASGTVKQTMQRVLQRKDGPGSPPGGQKGETSRGSASPVPEHGFTVGTGEAVARQRPPVSPSSAMLKSRALNGQEAAPGRKSVVAQGPPTPCLLQDAAIGSDRPAGLRARNVLPSLQDAASFGMDGLRISFDMKSPDRPHSEPSQRPLADPQGVFNGQFISDYVQVVKSWSYDGTGNRLSHGGFGQQPVPLIGVINDKPSQRYPVGEVKVETGRWGDCMGGTPGKSLGTSSSIPQAFGPTLSHPGTIPKDWAGMCFVPNPSQSSPPEGPLWRRAPAFVEPFLHT